MNADGGDAAGGCGRMLALRAAGVRRRDLHLRLAERFLVRVLRSDISGMLVDGLELIGPVVYMYSTQHS